MINFLLAKHRWTYIHLAIKYYTWPEHVYNLAHGKGTHGRKDSAICHELLREKIIFRHQHSQNADDYAM